VADEERAAENTAAPSPDAPSEEELLAALDKIGVADVLVQALAASASIGFRRVSAEARDLPQARLAIESIRALEPVLRDCGVEESLVRDLEQARTNLQLAYAKAVSEDGGDDG
jgi:biotin carboxylase